VPSNTALDTLQFAGTKRLIAAESSAVEGNSGLVFQRKPSVQLPLPPDHVAERPWPNAIGAAQMPQQMKVISEVYRHRNGGSMGERARLKSRTNAGRRMRGLSAKER